MAEAILVSSTGLDLRRRAGPQLHQRPRSRLLRILAEGARQLLSWGGLILSSSSPRARFRRTVADYAF